jgi:hypothetical protein
MLGSVVDPGSLSSGECEAMYRLLETYFAGTSRTQFDADLAEKECAILLRDADSGQIQGFSTSMRLTNQVDGETIVAFFSGDTIVAREYWGDTLLSRLWSHTIFSAAESAIAANEAARAYWFLICSGYRTWRFLPVFFREFYPNPQTPTPPRVQKLMDTLGRQKFGDQYLPGAGVVRFHAAAPLRPGISDVTEERLHDPYVAFFARMNPGHVCGDELACLTEVSRANLTRAGARMVAGGAKLVEG